ncbi:hypothetical protein GQ53DRAFT_760402 [Thozetella sp. PMI_491]|nr:hypothetical protein GQ53DRAFT_760402 [Thozetella sp. PMI_491]
MATTYEVSDLIEFVSMNWRGQGEIQLIEYDNNGLVGEVKVSAERYREEIKIKKWYKLDGNMFKGWVKAANIKRKIVSLVPAEAPKSLADIGFQVPDSHTAEAIPEGYFDFPSVEDGEHATKRRTPPPPQNTHTP